MDAPSFFRSLSRATIRGACAIALFSALPACASGSAPVEKQVVVIPPSTVKPMASPPDDARPAPSSETHDTSNQTGGLGLTGVGPIPSTPSHAPSIRMGNMHVEGATDPDIVARIMRQNFGRFGLCYEGGLRRDPTLEGNLTIDLVIGASGNVTSVSKGSASLNDRKVVECLLHAIQNIAFPAPDHGVVNVSYPLNLSPPG